MSRWPCRSPGQGTMAVPRSVSQSVLVPRSVVVLSWSVSLPACRASCHIVIRLVSQSRQHRQCCAPCESSAAPCALRPVTHTPCPAPASRAPRLAQRTPRLASPWRPDPCLTQRRAPRASGHAPAPRTPPPLPRARRPVPLCTAPGGPCFPSRALRPMRYVWGHTKFHNLRAQRCASRLAPAGHGSRPVSCPLRPGASRPAPGALRPAPPCPAPRAP